MFISGFKSGILTNCVNTFIKNNSRASYINKSFVYVVKLDDKTMKIGSTNFLYNRFKNYSDIYPNSKILSIRQFNYSSHEFNEVFKDKLIKYNRDYVCNKGYCDTKYESNILKTKKDLIDGKYHIMDMD